MVVCTKKQGHLSEQELHDPTIGDQWDHNAIEAETKLLLSLIPGKRTEENTRSLVEDVRKRSRDHRPPKLTTSDAYKPYEAALLSTFGQDQERPRRYPRGRKPLPIRVPDPDLRYVVVHKKRTRGRVVKVDRRIVFGRKEDIKQVLEHSSVSTRANTSIIERFNGSDRHMNARKTRKTYRFSKQVDVHEAMSFLTLLLYNFCRPHGSLRAPAADDSERCYQERSPAMAAHLTDHIWTTREVFSLPIPMPRR